MDKGDDYYERGFLTLASNEYVKSANLEKDPDRKKALFEKAVHLLKQRDKKRDRFGKKAQVPYGHGKEGVVKGQRADPQEKLIFVFLSNRVYPSAENNKLVEMNIRTRIQDLIYQSLGYK